MVRSPALFAVCFQHGETPKALFMLLPDFDGVFLFFFFCVCVFVLPYEHYLLLGHSCPAQALEIEMGAARR
jgi:hypothetical protein